MVADHNREVQSPVLHAVSCFSARREASLLYTRVAIFSIPPTIKTGGIDQAIRSIALTGSSYAHSSGRFGIGWSSDSISQVEEN